jgi:hypothetical protein
MNSMVLNILYLFNLENNKIQEENMTRRSNDLENTKANIQNEANLYE